MKLHARRDGTVSVLEINGRFDSHTAGAVSDWLDDAAGIAPAQVVINMNGVSFVDSTALATLVSARRRCQERMGELHLCGLQKPVYMVFELTRLNKTFAIFSDEQHAIQAFD